MNEAPTVPEMTATELKARMDDGDIPLLVDVREPFEAQIADLPKAGQLRIPTGQVLQRYSEIDTDREVVVYCRSGARSERVVAMLLQSGYDRVYNLKGGVLAWRADVDPSLTAY